MLLNATIIIFILLYYDISIFAITMCLYTTAHSIIARTRDVPTVKFTVCLYIVFTSAIIVFNRCHGTTI